MEASYFIDNKERIFVPYKGWMTRDSNGIESKDEFTTKIKGPFKDIPDPLGHGLYHTLDNLIGHDGKKILPKGVRHITFYPEGYYYIDDNNEDELINRGDVRGGFLTKDYIEQKNIVNTAGKILSDIWFDELTPMVNGYFRVSIDGKSNLMDIDGNLLLKVYERNLCDYIKGDGAFSFHDGFLFSNSPSGQTQIRQFDSVLENDTTNLHLLIRGGRVCPLAESIKNIRPNSVYMIIRDPDKKMNIFYEGCVIFNEWYDDIRFTGVKGLFLVKRENSWKLLDIAERTIGCVFDNIITSNFIHNHMLVQNNGNYAVVNYQGVVQGGFTSAMWADKGIWGMNVVHNNRQEHYFHGQGNGIINYAQQVLTSMRGGFLLEKEYIWYLIDFNGDLTPILKVSPKQLLDL